MVNVSVSPRSPKTSQSMSSHGFHYGHFSILYICPLNINNLANMVVVSVDYVVYQCT